jgi:hypothetical protein
MDKQALMSTRFMFDLDQQQGQTLGNRAELSKMPDQYSATNGPTGPRG